MVIAILACALVVLYVRTVYTAHRMQAAEVRINTLTTLTTKQVDVLMIYVDLGNPISELMLLVDAAVRQKGGVSETDPMWGKAWELFERHKAATAQVAALHS